MRAQTKKLGNGGSWLLALVTLSALPLVPSQCKADTLTVQVGYADNIRPSPFFPSPWDGSPGVALFAGNGTGGFDSGAILITNTDVNPITIDNVSVTVPSWSAFRPNGSNTQDVLTSGDEWNAFAASFPLTLTPGQSLILTQNGAINGNNSFDTSDFGAVVDGTPLDSTNNCSPGNAFALAHSAGCAAIAPTITVTTSHGSQTVTDSAQVLDTGGFDFVNANPCPVVGDTPGNCNESLQWRLAGTTGIGNPGGNVPEPSSVVLFGTGLLASLTLLRRKMRRQ
jgi:hypothetical protein